MYCMLAICGKAAIRWTACWPSVAKLLLDGLHLALCGKAAIRTSRRAVVSYWRKYVHEVLVNSLGGLSLPRKSVVRLTDRPDMTLDVYRGRKTTMQCKNAIRTSSCWPSVAKLLLDGLHAGPLCQSCY